jgi:multidrug efflux pump subunit AcrA (membrane-fusion protein)
VVPRGAVTRIDGKPTVFVSVAANAVEPRPVELGPEDDQRVAVLAGLARGERVVASGVLALKSELFR